MRKFETGATRDNDENKIAFDKVMSAEVSSRYSSYLREGMEIAWAAGVFEGEGCIYKGSGNALRLQIRMTDRDVLDRFCLIMGKGKVYGPYKTKQSKKGKVIENPKWKDNYSWQVHGQDAIESARLLFPYLGPRRVLKLMDVLNSRTKTNQPDFMPAEVIQAFGEYMHKNRVGSDGSLRAPDNWKKGIPIDAYMASSWRHLQDVWLHHDGRPDLAREPLVEALCGVLFNVQGYLYEVLKQKAVDNLEETSRLPHN